MGIRLLLLSSGSGPGGEFLKHASATVQRILGDNVETVLFVPFGSVLPLYDDITAVVRQGFLNMLYDVTGLHAAPDAKEAVATARAIVVGGGNTFKLMKSLYDLDLVAAIRDRVRSGVPYIGWSAGANIAAPTIKTTNDMPIVEPPSLDALGLVPFQINPHFPEPGRACDPGESRTQRLTEFCELNPEARVIGLPDSSMLTVEGQSIRLEGRWNISVFAKGRTPVEYGPEDPLEFLLNPKDPA